MLMLTFAGFVGILPAWLGRLTGFAAGSLGVAEYVQLSKSAGGLNGGSTPACGAAVLGVGATELVVLDAVGVGWELFLKNTVHTARPATTITTAASAAMVKIRRRRAWFARFSSCRSNLRFAVARRCLLVGTPSSSCVVCSSPEGSSSRVSVFWPPSVPCSAGRPTRQWETGPVLLTGFPAGMLQCNCYVLAQRPGSDAIVVDPGQRAMAQLRRILDEHRLTPAAVLLTHGHIDHIWSAQKVCDSFGIPAYIHPADRAMLGDPIRGFGPRLGQILAGALFREPRRVIELRDGDTLEVAGITVTADHTPGHTPGS